jgi:hypothetical protein
MDSEKVRTPLWDYTVPQTPQCYSPRGAIIGDRASEQVLRVNRGHRMGPWIQD